MHTPLAEYETVMVLMTRANSLRKPRTTHSSLMYKRAGCFSNFRYSLNATPVHAHKKRGVPSTCIVALSDGVPTPFFPS